jgi:DNA-binding transcriptional MerR regulator
MGNAMTIGRLSRRTGVSVKLLREYEDLGLIYTVGRSEGNYRLFDDEAVWCVGVVTMLRGLGLTLAEITELAATYLQATDEPVGLRVASLLETVRARTMQQIEALEGRLRRIEEFEAAHVQELAGRLDFRAHDPRFPQNTA